MTARLKNRRYTTIGHTLKEAVDYAIHYRYAGIVEKDGYYQSAKDWDEVKHAEAYGWKYIGHCLKELSAMNIHRTEF